MPCKCFGNRNFYHVLGLQPSADVADIRRKYRQVALRMHPDKGGSAESFHLLTLAFEVMSCPSTRAAYDATFKQFALKRADALMLPQHLQRTLRPGKSGPDGAASAAKRAKRAASSRRPACHPQALHSKRPAMPCKAHSEKRQCTHQDYTSNPECCQQCLSRLGTPMNQLQHVLKCMTSEQRQAALQSMKPRLQIALLRFMETSPQHLLAAPTKRVLVSHTASVSNPSPVSGIVTAPNLANAKYKAHMHIKALRFYTRGHAELETTLEQQMVLVQLRQALYVAAAQNPSLWEDPSQTYQICVDVFEANNTSEEKLELGTYTYIRAGHWLLKDCSIISPVMPLAEAISLHSRLLRARQASWWELRQEWVQLMQCTRHTMAKRKSLREAEAVADAARASALKIQLSRAINSTTTALEQEHLRVSRHQQREIRRRMGEKRAAARLKSKAAQAERRSAKVRLETRKLTQRWWRRSDLTLSDMMQGPPRAMAGGS